MPEHAREEPSLGKSATLCGGSSCIRGGPDDAPFFCHMGLSSGLMIFLFRSVSIF